MKYYIETDGTTVFGIGAGETEELAIENARGDHLNHAGPSDPEDYVEMKECSRPFYEWSARHGAPHSWNVDDEGVARLTEESFIDPLKEVLQLCSKCGTLEVASRTKGMGEVEMWEMTCGQCRTNQAGFMEEGEVEWGRVKSGCRYRTSKMVPDTPDDPEDGWKEWDHTPHCPSCGDVTEHGIDLLLDDGDVTSVACPTCSAVFEIEMSVPIPLYRCREVGHGR